MKNGVSTVTRPKPEKNVSSEAAQAASAAKTSIMAPK